MVGGKVRVALVDDHQLFREGLKALLTQQPDLTVVAEASDARQAYGMIEAIHPDVVVLDVGLPGVDGIAAARELRRRVPDGHVLILTMHDRQHDGERYAAAALAAGAAGYALKSQAPASLFDAIRAVARGETYVSPQLSVESVRAQMRGGFTSTGPLAALSPREREVFDLIVRGFSNPGVATELCISVKTVETHRARIHRKFGVHSVAELVRYAALNGLIKQ
jgi:DNA-binding NarL/FixJ family response regulator